MAFGILECHRMEIVPGTALLRDQTDIPEELSAIPAERLKHGTGRFSHVLLVPQPSDSPNDPLNWPTWKKDTILFIVGMNAAVVGAYGPMLGPGFVPISEQLGITVDTLSHATAWLILMLGLCVFVFNPLAKIYGKRPCYVVASLILFVVSIWGAVADNYSSFLGSRVLGGIGMAPYEVLVQATISDIYFVHERGTRIAAWNLFLLCGIAGAGFVSGYIIEDLGYEWTFGICAILFGIFGLGILFFVPETAYIRPAVSVREVELAKTSLDNAEAGSKASEKGIYIEHHEDSPSFGAGALTGNGTSPSAATEPKMSYWKSLAFTTGRYSDAAIWKIFTRPFIVFWYPCVLWGFLVYGTTLTWIVVFSVVNGVIFVAPPYNFSVSQTGLISLSPFILTIIGEVVSGPLNDYICLHLARRNHGVYEPEFRLVLMVVVAIVGTVGFFGFGATIHFQTHWSGPVLCFGFSNMALAFASTCVFGYVLDCYPRLAEEAFVAINTRNLLTFGLTYFVNSWLANDGALSVFNVLGACFLAVCALTIPLWIFGKKIRSWVARNQFLNDFMRDIYYAYCNFIFLLEVDIAKLASTRVSAQRITSLTTSRLHGISSIVFDRHASRTYQRNFHSTPTTNKGILSTLTNLLTGHQSQQTAAPDPKQQSAPKEPERVTAEFEPTFRQKYRHDTPTFSWRRRLQIGGLKNPRHEGADDGHTKINALGEVVFYEKHRACLHPRFPPFFTEYFKPTYQALYKMRSYVQILTTPTADTPGTTLLLHFDNKRYLIGSLAEGTQRACVQMGARLLKVSECFLTGRTEWTNTGGLIGMILTLADSSASSAASSWEDALKKVKTKAKKLGIMDGTPEMKQLEEQAKREASNTLTIFGPPNLNHTLATARRYVFRKGMPVNIHEIRDGETRSQREDEWAPFWADENIKVWAMSISPSKPGRASATPPEARSPPKRSLDEAFGEKNGTPTVSEDLTQKERDYLTVKAVVSEMFNSSWRLDTLYETSLADVKQTATVFVRNAQTNKIEKYRGPMPGGKEPVPDVNLKVLVRRPWPGALVESLPDAEPAKEAVSYIIRNHMQRGKFHPERAQKLKVPKGQAWAQLSKGESVQNSDGETITSEQVLDPSRVGGGIAVVDLPGPEYIDNLISRPEWREPKVMEGVGCFTWICGKDVATDPRLQAFMKEFNHLEHVVSSPDYSPNNIALDSAAAATVRLREVDPARYTVPVHDAEDDVPQAYGGTSAYRDVRTSQPLPARIAVRGQVVQLEPSIEIQTKDAIPPLKITETAAEVPKEVMEEALKAQEASKTIDSDMQKWLDSLPPGAKDAQVTTLGTGSALPSKYRNVSSTLVRVPGWGNILLDAGENTLGQLKRVFGPELEQILQDLKILWISHMHADHQLGTTSVIKEWYQQVHGSQPASCADQKVDYSARLQQQKRLAIISEPAMLQWLHEYSSLEDYGHSRLAPLSVSKSGRDWSRLSWFIPPAESKDLSWEDSQRRLEEAVLPPSALDLADIQAVQVRHCHGARAVSMTTPSGFKVSYSGDCRPSKDFARIGQGSTVCIHEATFDDELQGDAEAKNHSTTSEALDIAQRMRAKACVLTHFSQRYQKVPVLERGDEELPPEEEMDTAADESANTDDNMDAPLADVAEQTLPYQPATEGDSGQQYDLPPKVGAAGEAIRFKLNSDMKVCVAFDYMNVKVGDIGHMEKFTPALLKLFAEEDKSQQADVAAQNGNGGAAAASGGKKDRKKGKSQRNN